MKRDKQEKLDETTVKEDVETANLIYTILLSAVLFPILPSIAAALMAFINKRGAPEWLQTHFAFQLGTIWKGFLMGFVGLLLLPIWIGALILAFLYYWWVVRAIKAMKLLKNKRPIPDPGTWIY
jgi:uncharacterized membrane protein